MCAAGLPSLWCVTRAVFTPDANAFYLDMPPCYGYQAIEDTCRTALEPMSATQHLISNVVVRLDGDRAESTRYLQARHVKAGTPGRRQLHHRGPLRRPADPRPGRLAHPRAPPGSHLDLGQPAVAGG